MEVHAHTHTPRKKWTHYFWEFLMLFLAVFCGFLAENQREHYIEHQREKQYIKSMVKDLIQDTINILENITFNQQILKGKDSLVQLLLSPDTDKFSAVREKIIYRLFKTYATSFKEMSFTDRTISQLKSSGSLRLIRSQAASDSISEYYRLVTLCQIQGGIAESYSHETIINSFNLFNIYYIIRPDSVPPVLRTKDADKLMDYTNRLTIDGRAAANYMGKLTRQKAMAKRVFDFLKKEYHLE